MAYLVVTDRFASIFSVNTDPEEPNTMPTFIVTEMQHVIACRKVDAADGEAALEAFHEGEGEEYGCDGDVISSELRSITQES